jgi:two-component system cell cycle response regulator
MTKLTSPGSSVDDVRSHAPLSVVNDPRPNTGPLPGILLSLLMVEADSADIRLLEEVASELQPAPVIERAGSLAEALARLAAKHYDLVLLDLELPDSEGLDTFRDLHAAVPGMPIVVLTNLDDGDVAISSVRLGAEDYLVKSETTPPLLRRALRHAVERHSRHERLRRLSLTDDLTGLYNRRGFLAVGSQQLGLAGRRGMAVRLGFMDVDQLKAINDTHGHKTGDDAIRAVAVSLRRVFRATDVLARVGGDEFAVLILDSGPESDDSLRARITRSLADEALEPPVAVSTGFITAPSGTKLEDLLAEADARMYANKREHHEVR